MAKDYVQKYLWRDYGQPFHLAWQITLTAEEAVAFLAAVYVLITYTQTRTWSLARQTVSQIVRPIQLPDNDDPNSLSRLSQYEALSRLLSNTLPCLRRRKNLRPASDMSRKISPLFGIASVTNATLFIIMGVLVSRLLTDGLETPMVQSRSWYGCRVGEQSGHPTGVYFSTNRLTGQGNLYRAVEKHGPCWKVPPGSPASTCDRTLSEFQVSHENLTETMGQMFRLPCVTAVASHAPRWISSLSSFLYDATGPATFGNKDFSIPACREQHRFCLDTSPQICTRYTNSSNALEEIYDALLENDNASTAKELYAFHQLFYKNQHSRTPV
ncbi:hypothetical protein V8F33_009482 [Rhypophila sp. PSN 637]